MNERSKSEYSEQSLKPEIDDAEAHLYSTMSHGALLEIGWGYLQTQKNELAEFVRTIETMATHSNNPQFRYETELLKARVLVWEDQNIKALEIASNAYQHLNQTTLEASKVRALRTLSWIYFFIGQFEESLQYAFKALKLYGTLKETVKEAGYPIEPHLLTTIAAVYMRTNRYAEALEFQLKSLDLAEAQGQPNIVTILINLSENYLNLLAFDQALAYCERAFSVAAKEPDNSQLRYQCHTMRGHIYMQTDRFEEAKSEFETALRLAQVIDRKHYQVHVLQRLGQLAIKQKAFSEAVDLLKSAEQLAQSITSAAQRKEITFYLSEAYEGLGEMQSSIAAYKTYKEISDDILSNTVQTQLNQYVVEFKVEKSQKDAEIFRLKNIELKKKTEELEAAYRQIEVIAEIGKDITSSLNLNDVLTSIYEHFNQLMKADVFGIGLYSNETKCIDFRLFIEDGVKLEPFEMSMKEGRGYSAACIASREVIYVPQVDRKTSALIPVGINDQNHEVQSLIYCPLIFNNDIIGLLTVQSYEPNAYSTAQYELVKALASFIAIALNNSYKSEQLEKTAKLLERLSNTDPLTGLHNRRSFRHYLEEEAAKFERFKRPFAVIMTDIDHFKTVNDTCGHDCGDEVLKQVAQILKDCVRHVDHVARWGGEEFLILLPETSQSQAKVLAERIRQKIESTDFMYAGKHNHITMTLGTAAFDGQCKLDEVIKQADQALYEGKRAGRNCVKLYQNSSFK